MKRTVLLCGGHVTPAIALIDELSKNNTVHIVYAGRRHAAEYGLITQKRIRFLPLNAGKRTLAAFALIPIGFIQALWICLRQRPNIIVSFGGYVALPLALSGWILGIPVITHEQTLSPGLANRIIARIAKKVCVTFEETRHLFPEKKTVVTGLPMRKELFSKKKTVYHPPLLFITGGSQGAKSLNEKIAPTIPILTKTYQIVHQTGRHEYTNFTGYRTKQFISVEELSELMTNAALVIGRSGANTTMELAALGKVALLVPLPWSAGNEQLLQARWLHSHAGAEVIEQKDLTPETLLARIKKIETEFQSLQNRASEFAKTIPRNGAALMALEVGAVWS